MNENQHSPTVGELSGNWKRQLAARLGAGEAEAIVRLTFETLFSWRPVDIVMRSDWEATPYMSRKISEVEKRLKADEPIQYILGQARFFGLDLKVTPAVLIPRPETEELVQLVIDFIGERTDAHLLDACTGSGCIALALARNLRFAEITAIDISGEALAVARENACNLKADVNFLQADALKMSGLPGQPWDAIVSNPPYITPSEKGAMERNVLEYEPQQALFVPENEPLKFYEAIARYGLGTLKQQGGIFFEINPLYASALVELMQSLGYEEVALSRDMFGKERFLTAKKPEKW